MRTLRKIYNKVFNPYKIDTCSICNHTSYFHREERAKAGYPGVTCYGYNGLQPSWEKRCRCPGYIAKTNLDYLEYKDKEANG